LCLGAGHIPCNCDKILGRCTPQQVVPRKPKGSNLFPGHRIFLWLACGHFIAASTKNLESSYSSPEL
jgi:hypothetical protein